MAPTSNPFGEEDLPWDGRERRRWPRRRWHRLAFVHLRGPDAPAARVAGAVLDQSPGGLALVLRRPLPVGAGLTVEPLGEAPVDAYVVRCHEHADGWLVGCGLLDSQADGQAAASASAPAAPAPPTGAGGDPGVRTSTR